MLQNANRLLGIVVVLVALLCAPSVASSQTIAEMVAGEFKTCGLNELCEDSTVDDPPKFRGGVIRKSESWGRGLFALSGDLVHLSGSREEMVLMQFKESEYQGVKDRGGEFYLGLKKPNTGSSDDAMFDALVASYRDGFQFRLPIYAPNLNGGSGTGGGGSAPLNYLLAGAYQLHVQASDGNFVLYEVVGSTMCARWAISWLPHNGTGFIDATAEGLPEVCR
jgi:hypothetical protein